jgi:hypothetical protein
MLRYDQASLKLPIALGFWADVGGANCRFKVDSLYICSNLKIVAIK